jgi:hypothetical protein
MRVLKIASELLKDEKVDNNSHEFVAKKQNECFKCNFNKISKQRC